MATKAEIKQKIQDSLTLNGVVTTRLKHEEFLHTQAESILENVYGDELVEDETTSVVFSKTISASCTYILRIVKQGRRVTVNGVVNSLQSPLNQFSFTSDLEYIPVQNVKYFNSAKVYITQGVIDTNESVTVGINRVGSSASITAGGLMNGESARFQFTYNTEN